MADHIGREQATDPGVRQATDLLPHIDINECRNTGHFGDYNTERC